MAKLILEIKDEIYEWFKDKKFIPIRFYEEVESAMKNSTEIPDNKVAEKLQTILNDYNKQIEDLEYDLEAYKRNLYIAGKLCVYKKVMRDLDWLLEVEE